jgi:hypothetical protein
MAFLPDPGELDALARRITEHAAAARRRAYHLGAVSAALGWRGLAATAFHAEEQLAVAGLRRAAGRLDDAADALFRHAGRVRVVYADVGQLGRDAARTAADLLLDPSNLLDDAGQLLADGTNLVGDALHAFGL